MLEKNLKETLIFALLNSWITSFKIKQWNISNIDFTILVVNSTSNPPPHFQLTLVPPPLTYYLFIRWFLFVTTGITQFVLGSYILNTTQFGNDPNTWLGDILIDDCWRLALDEVSLMTSTIEIIPLAVSGVTW